MHETSDADEKLMRTTFVRKMAITPISARSDRLATGVLIWIGALLLMVCLWLLLIRGQMDLLCAVLICATLLLVTLHNRGTGAILTLGYLTVMGDIRRMVAAAFGQPKLDLLLLVGPMVVLILALPMIVRLRLKDWLSKAMLFLLVIMLAEMFNPQQGGLAVGASGALFYIVPVLWFWVGRQIGSPVVVDRLLYKCIFPLAVLAAVMGFCQTFIGFFPYQQAWIKLVANSYHSLHVGSSIRAFGFSVSGAEYATLLTFGAAGTAAAALGYKRVWAIAFPFLLLGVVLSSARTLVLKLVVALAVIWIVRKGKKLNTIALVRLGVLTVVGLAVVFWVASKASPGSSEPTHGKGSAVQDALQHEAGGLAHPLNQKYSSAGVHGKMVVNGLKQGIVDPIGHGLGATTHASSKFGGDTSTGSSEIDFTDMFISLGLAGGLVYLFIVFEAVRYAVRYVQRVPREISLPMVAILATTLSAWLIGGQYSTSSMVFFLVGALVYEENRSTASMPKKAVMNEQVTGLSVLPA